MWIYEHKDWPNFSWDQESVTPCLIKVRHIQGRLLGRMLALGFDLKQEASLNTLTNDVLKSSAIEGEALNPEEVRSSIARRLGIDMASLVPASRDVEGIVEMMLDATQNFKKPLTQDRLFDWHAALFPTGRSGMQRITVGAYRPEEAGAMQVVSGPIGLEKVHFEAPGSKVLKIEMDAFLKWLDKNSDMDAVITAAIAHLWFVTIHPFEDGNGRIARAIADMALARADNTAERFYSMSAQIEAERKDYYAQLEAQQKSDVDITKWLLWFLKCLERAIEGAEDTLATVLHKSKLWDHLNQTSVNGRQRLIVNRMFEDFKGHMNTSKYAKLAKCSTDTAFRDIKELLEMGAFIKNPGSGRSTSYRLASVEELES
ncbi:MAG: Fic family protein [Alphaproteobacteria bacterium]